MRAFCGFPLVARVLAHGSTKSSIVTTKGVQFDLRVVEPAVWGAALMYFTGSKAHNIRIRQIATFATLGMRSARSSRGPTRRCPSPTARCCRSPSSPTSSLLPLRPAGSDT
jgi:DNA polymerase (family 10)